MTLTEEQNLIKSIINDDQRAFKQICKIYYEMLYNFIWRKTGNENLSKDIVQELFLNVWKLRKHLNPNKSFKSYLYSAANNLTINHFKSIQIQQKYFSESKAGEYQNSEKTQLDFNEYLDDVLSGMTEEQKTVFILNKFEGFKYKEIATILNISVKTVESRMRKILKVLREKLAHLLFLLTLVRVFIILNCISCWE